MRAPRCTLPVMLAALSVLCGCGGGGGGEGGEPPPPPPPPPVVQVNGRVLDATTAAGIRGAIVRLLTRRSPGGGVSRADEKSDNTDANGYYSIPGVQPGKAAMSITLPDGSYGAIEIEIDIPATRSIASIIVRLVPRSVQVTAISLSPTSSTLSVGNTLQFACLVTSVPAGVSPTFAIADGDGTISSSGLFTATQVGTVRVVAQAGGKQASATVVVTQPAAPTTGTITGMVTDGATGLGISQGLVRASGPQAKSAETLADGQYTLSGLAAGAYSVTASDPRYRDRVQSGVSVVAGRVTVVDLQLTRLPSGVTVLPSPVSVPVQGTQTFHETVTGLNPGVAWSVQEGAAGGSISSEGVYTAPATAGTYHVVATSTADGTTKGTAVVSVRTVVAVQPAGASLPPGGTQQFTANVQGSTNKRVLWSVPGGAATGSITSGGLYTAPQAKGSYVVKATGEALPAGEATVTVRVESGTATGTID